MQIQKIFYQIKLESCFLPPKNLTVVKTSQTLHCQYQNLKLSYSMQTETRNSRAPCYLVWWSASKSCIYETIYRRLIRLIVICHIILFEKPTIRIFHHRANNDRPTAQPSFKFTTCLAACSHMRNMLAYKRNKIIQIGRAHV